MQRRHGAMKNPGSDGNVASRRVVELTTLDDDVVGWLVGGASLRNGKQPDSLGRCLGGKAAAQVASQPREHKLQNRNPPLRSSLAGA